MVRVGTESTENSPKMLSKDEIEHFDSLADGYKDTHDEALKFAGGDSDYFYHMKIDLIKKQLAKRPKKILDYGCGTGRLMILLKTAFPEAIIVGFDPSTESVKICEQEIKKKSLVDISVHSELANVGGSFDLIISAGVFHHIPAGVRTSNIEIVKSKMNDKAQFIIFEHNPISPLTRVLLAWAGNDKDAELVWPWRMSSLLKRQGLEVSTQFISFFPPYLKKILFLEEYLRSIPLGAQYMISAKYSKEV